VFREGRLGRIGGRRSLLPLCGAEQRVRSALCLLRGDQRRGRALLRAGARPECLRRRVAGVPQDQRWMTGCVGLPTNLQGPGGTHVRTIALVAAMLAFSACDSSPKSQPAPASPGGSRPTTPAAVASPADSGPGPVVSPNHSVRRAKPDEVSAGRAPLASECEGDACGVVTVTWLDPGYR